ncbi:LysM peptidoglycan-binding domain-containing protein [Limosilactobacillus walteri]|uniref:LysM peptidoglycan-binding domain-containing protein n=1 Tax=Limosilactobacillus walteri TaxID=2268022 RepID=A0ABR8P4S1_9LACO|nr:LysM peptidoglycan-binding domain-containing protein [Limosilactobacillus walteri]MBD5805997.1 LysM peptidoglycan-binding domain-containing protein [Limosilactobacillus walteri]
MVKKAHHSTNHRSRGVVTGAVSALSLLAVSTQAVNAEQLTVKAGDTMWGLAKQHGLSVSALEQANPSVKKLSDSVDLITVGQQLTLPAPQHDASADLNVDGSYTVRPGDTLSSIADRYNISVNQLMSWNNLTSSDSLYIGQQLSVTGPVANTATAPVQQSPVATTAQPVVSAVPVVTPQSAVASQQASSQAATTTAQTPAASSVNAASQTSPVTTANSTSAAAPVSATDTQSTTAASTVVAAGSSAMASTAPVVSATNNAAASQSTAPTTVQYRTQSAANTVALANNTSQASVSNNSATLYSQSFVQTAPVASQAPQAQTVLASQVNTTPQSSVQQSAVASQAQPQQAPASQPATNASQDLQHGSVVSLATKIANSNSVPYVWGGENLSGMDCSGLVKYVYANAEGKQLPHYTGALENCVDQHPVSQAKPGDLLFWGNHGSTYHTAIYTGNNQYVAAAKPGTNVATYTISPYFNPSFAGTVK